MANNYVDDDGATTNNNFCSLLEFLKFLCIILDLTVH